MAAQETMTVAVVYEDGIFRPLEPLDLPKHTEGNVTFNVAQGTDEMTDEEFDALFAAAGIPFVKMPTDGLRMLTDEEQNALDQRIGPGRPLSEIIIEERESGW